MEPFTLLRVTVYIPVLTPVMFQLHRWEPDVSGDLTCNGFSLICYEATVFVILFSDLLNTTSGSKCTMRALLSFPLSLNKFFWWQVLRTFDSMLSEGTTNEMVKAGIDLHTHTTVSYVSGTFIQCSH